MISGGRLRWTATVQSATTTTDALGRRANAFTDSGTMRADLREGGAAEQVYADGVATVQAYEVRVRWNDAVRLGVRTIDRLVIRGKLLRITGIENLEERDRVAVISCQEVN